MEDMNTLTKFLLINLVLFNLVFIGCSSLNHTDENKLKLKMIKNYSKTEFFDNHEVYEIVKYNIESDIEIYMFARVQFYTPLLKDTIGSVSYTLPTNYKKYKGKIFFWQGGDSIVTKEILKELRENVKLDSAFYKNDLGIALELEDYPKIEQDNSESLISYFVCKKNKRVLGSQYSSFSPYEDIKKLNCNIKKDNFKEIFPRNYNLLNYPTEE